MRKQQPAGRSQPGRSPTDPSPDATAPDRASGSRPRARRGSQRGPAAVVTLVARVVLAAAVLAVAIVVVWWWAIGGRWETVRTASMGTYAPVGTLLWVKPTRIADLHVGDVITFHPPVPSAVPGQANPPLEEPSQTYTHRVVAVDPDGTVQTKGDLNPGRDPWRIDQRHLVGYVTARWPGVGWLVRALPVVAPGAVALWVFTWLFWSKRSRAPLRVVGMAVLVAVAIVVYHPLYGETQVSYAPLGARGPSATYVGTGLLPVKLEAHGASPVLLRDGEERSIRVPRALAHGRFDVKIVPDTPWQVWAIILAAAMAPAVWSVAVGVEPPPPRRRRGRQRTRGPAPAALGLQRP